jgi:hypothetical protein
MGSGQSGEGTKRAGWGLCEELVMRAELQDLDGGASGRPGGSPTGAEDGQDGGSRRERPGDRVVRGGGEDRRLAGRETIKADVVGGRAGQMVWRVCRDLVNAATRGWHGSTAVNRDLIAKLLNTTPGTLGRMMGPNDTLNFRADQLHALMTAEHLVPEEARAAAAAAIAREWGGVFVPQAEIHRAGVAATTAALGLASAAGRTAALVAQAMAPESPGGTSITEQEREEIERSVGEAQQAAGQVLASVEEERGG